MDFNQDANQDSIKTINNFTEGHKLSIFKTIWKMFTKSWRNKVKLTFLPFVNIFTHQNYHVYKVSIVACIISNGKCFIIMILISVFVCLLGYVADAAAGGAYWFCHSDRGSAQRTGVCGEGLQTRGQNYCVRARIHTHINLRLSPSG